MPKTGRPRIEIDKKAFENLCGMQCTLEEICGFFSASEDTINRFCKKEYGKSFAGVFAEKRAGGRISLRRSQFRLAETNAAMGIWLGKQYLGQKDSIDNNDAIELVANVLVEVRNQADAINRQTGGIYPESN